MSGGCRFSWAQIEYSVLINNKAHRKTSYRIYMYSPYAKDFYFEDDSCACQKTLRSNCTQATAKICWKLLAWVVFRGVRYMACSSLGHKIERD